MFKSIKYQVYHNFVFVLIDKRLPRYGLNLEDVQNVISAAVGGVSAGQIFEGIRRFDIFVRYTPEARATKDDIRQNTHRNT